MMVEREITAAAPALRLQTLWEDDDLEIVAVPGEGDQGIVVFGSVEESARDGRYEFFATATAGGRPAVFVRDKQFQWYQRPGVADRIMDVVGPYLEGGRVTALGHSMGGYGACMFGAALGAASVLAFGPQFSMEDGFARHDPRWPEMRARMGGFPLGSVEEAVAEGTQYFVLHGENGPDILHWSHFPEGHNIHHYLVARVWHHVPKHLKGLGALDEVVEVALDGDVDGFDAAMARLGGRPRKGGESYATRPNYWYRENVLGRSE